MAKKIAFENIRDFDPDQIFDCGQCFRWERIGEKDLRSAVGEKSSGRSSGSSSGWRGVVGRRVASVVYDECKSRLTVFDSMLGSGECTLARARKFWSHYFDLDRDYAIIKKKLSRADMVMRVAIKEGSGIRILNQDPWETLVSFIISQNNNIPRIKSCIKSLTREFGEDLGSSPWQREALSASNLHVYAFPSPETVAGASVKDLAPCRLGYRDKYLIEAARQYIEWGGEEGMRQMEDLTAFAGVGPKVANCVSLFCLERVDSFPIDVWMRRVMHELYGLEEKDIKGMADFAEKRFAPYGGIAQQYLFYYITHKGVDKPGK